jgi:hypothetical protein
MLVERYIVAHASTINPVLYNDRMISMYGGHTTVIWDTKKNEVVVATDHFDELPSLERTCNRMNMEYLEELLYLDMIYKYVHG